MKIIKRNLLSIFSIILTFVSISAFAHSGGTDKFGCHKNHKTGVYHCH